MANKITAANAGCVVIGMTRLSQILHHRSLTASFSSLFFSFVAFAFLPEHNYRLRQQGTGYLTSATVTALVGLAVCGLTLFVLIRDNLSGYPSFRCSLATLVWALACVPVFWLLLVVVGDFFEMR